MLFRLLSRCSLAALISFTAYRIAEAQAAPAPSPSPSQTPAAQIGRVATSDRRSEPIGQTSRPTFVVDRSQIDAEGARTLVDALVGVPGVELFPYGPFGAQVDFRIRGAASERTLVLVDGQPISDPTTGTVDITQLSTAGVRRIEIVESAASALYGTNASGGVINVITNIPRGTYLEGSLGSFDDRDLRAGFGNGRIGASFERHVAANAYAYPAFTYGLPGCTTTAGKPCNYSAGVRDNAYGDQSSGRISADLPLPAGFATSQSICPGRHNARPTPTRPSAKTISSGDVRSARLKGALTGRGADLVAGVDLSRARAASLPFPATPFRRAQRLR